jgi:hypothetical protein
MKTLINFILFTGMFLIISGVYEQKLEAAKKEKQIEYRFIPRSLYEEQLGSNTTFAEKIKPMFESQNISGYDPYIEKNNANNLV